MTPAKLLNRQPNRTPEREVQRAIQLALADIPGLRLWRHNGGQGWAAPPNKMTTRKDINGDTLVTLRNPSRFANSTPPGFTDLFGFIETPTGPVPVFIEVKAEDGRVSVDQQRFIQAMLNAGCRAGVARNVEEARAIVLDTETTT